MSHSGSFPHLFKKLLKEFDDASNISITIRYIAATDPTRESGEFSIVSVNGCHTVNAYAHFIAFLATNFLEDTRDILFTLPQNERTCFLECLIARIRRLEKVVIPVYPGNPVSNRMVRRIYSGGHQVSSGNRVPRLLCDPRMQSCRWEFKAVSICFIDSTLKINQYEAGAVSTRAVTAMAWKFSAAWSQQLWKVRHMLEEQNRIMGCLPFTNTIQENSQIQQTKITLTLTRDELGAFFRVLKEANVFGNTPAGEICKMVVTSFSTKNCANLRLKRMRNIFDIPTPFALECCINECRNFIVICERLMERYN